MSDDDMASPPHGEESGVPEDAMPVSPGSDNNDIYGAQLEFAPEHEEEEEDVRTAQEPEENEEEEEQEQHDYARDEDSREQEQEQAVESGEQREEGEEEEEEDVTTAQEPEPLEPGEENVRTARGPEEDDEEEEEVQPKGARTPDMEEAEERPQEEEEASPSKRKRVLLDSDDEDDGGREEEEEGEKYALGGVKKELESPPKKRTVLNSDDEGDSDRDEGREKGEDEREGEGEGEQEVGNLMAHIFGDSDEEKEEGDEGDEGERRREDDDTEDRRRANDDDETFEWDFDVMLAQKKAEKSKRRRRRKDGGIDIINDDDGQIELLVASMKEAAKDDRHSNMERKPALKKRKMLPIVKAQLLKADLFEAMIDGGMMSALSEWLAPLPDKSLPALEVRSELLKTLQQFSKLDQGILKQSGLGKAVMMLFKHPRETKENKKLAHKLISQWARPIFQIDTDYRSITKDDRMQRDLEEMPAAKKRRLSTDDGPSGSGMGGEEEVPLLPGQKGFVGRARVPKPSTKDYVVRPSHSAEGFKAERKGRAFNRLDKATREFKERTKSNKAKRAIGVSIEGRRMDI